MKYCQNTTESHPLSKKYPQCLDKINSIIFGETLAENHDKINQPFNDEVALKLDKVKECSENSDVKKMHSMDIVLGVKDENDSFSSLLVEFKLNCKGIKSLTDSDCKDKIRDSKIILFGSGETVRNSFIFIFNNDYLSKNEARNEISRKLNNRTIEVLSIDQFKEKYF